MVFRKALKKLMALSIEFQRYSEKPMVSLMVFQLIDADGFFDGTAGRFCDGVIGGLRDTDGVVDGIMDYYYHQKGIDAEIV
mmetsp:Transcript_19957/g.28860  ORF Transcript_19957/g.28860 Transcript_19957/m.28860 type:complete len:81 (+) Transcript_19957:610-852(+)